MSPPPTLSWLPPPPPDWRARLQALRTATEPRWPDAVALARTYLDHQRTNALAAAVSVAFPQAPPDAAGVQPVRLAILGSSSTAHLNAGIRIGGLRRGLWIETFEPAYGQFRQELADDGSALRRFAPTEVLFALDAASLTAGLDAGMTAGEAAAAIDASLDRIEQGWADARRILRCPVLMQALLPVAPSLMGGNEHLLPGSRSNAIRLLNGRIRERAPAHGVDLVAIDERAALDGLDAWQDPALWHHAKQEISPAAAPVYGDLVARLLAARQGRSAKCLVLDLDDTLWGGVIGDDGIEKIVIGAGSALGEAFAAVQSYARELSRRGVILAVCSKNDETNALEPFERHPEMVLRRADIACFVANWDDKAANLKRIAHSLNIGLDALVFLDDNPFERERVRLALPEVAVPEVPDDPALVPARLAEAGYFESLALTEDDRGRTAQYRQNLERQAEAATASDLPSYLQGLRMHLLAAPFDRIGLARITQLVNKTNQFNLTSQRFAEAQLAAMIGDPEVLGLQLRLTDRLGDNGMIAVVIGRIVGDDLVLDSWLMSCRVLGRGVETATLAVLLEEARARGLTRLVGEYRPTPKNGMVRDHYAALGFAPLGEAGPDGSTRWVLAVAGARAGDHAMTIERPSSATPAMGAAVHD